jgi:hypothetical protein
MNHKILAVQGSRIGNTNLRMDIHGDEFGAAVLSGDRWRSAHDFFKHQISLDAKFLGLQTTKGQYGMFNHYFSFEGQDVYGRLNRQEKRSQTMVPDIVMNNHPQAHPSGAQFRPSIWAFHRAK